MITWKEFETGVSEGYVRGERVFVIVRTRGGGINYVLHVINPRFSLKNNINNLSFVPGVAVKKETAVDMANLITLSSKWR